MKENGEKKGGGGAVNKPRIESVVEIQMRWIRELRWSILSGRTGILHTEKGQMPGYVVEFFILFQQIFSSFCCTSKSIDSTPKSFDHKSKSMTPCD